MDLGLAAAASRSQVLPGALRPLISRMPKAQSPWNMRKEELLAALRHRDIPVHDSWSVPELRAILVEHCKQEKGIEPTETRGLAKMNLEQLVQECNKLEITMPTKPTRGALMLLIRNHTKSPGHTVMPFGRYKGWHYCEVPKGYKTWAVEEVSKNSNASEDLVRFAKWSKEDLIKNEPSPIPTHNLARDPEALATVPPPSMEQLESDSSTWSRVSHRPSRKGRRDTDMEEEHLVTHPKAEMVRLERRLEELKRAEKEKNMR